MKEEIGSFEPEDQQDWRRWLELHHESKKAVWLIIRKKGSGNPNLSWSQAVDEALCFGWIDSVKRTIDSEKYVQYFGKRKPTSIWSRINKEKVQVLTQTGQMQAAGMRCIEIAKKNGSWTILDSVEALEVPDDLEKALAEHAGAKDHFMSLSKSKKKGLLYWVISAKRPETRRKRIVEIAELAAQGTLPKQFI